MRGSYAFLAFSLTASALYSGDVSFIAPLTLQATRPVTVAAGDLNKDGKLDLLSADGAGEIDVLIQDQAQRDKWQRSTLKVGSATYMVRAADFDEDGFDDILAADPGSTAFFVHNKGDGTFERPLALREARLARWITAGDWNKDGSLDVATANFASATVSIYMGDGKGNLLFLKNHNVSKPHAVEALDYDGDGNLDLMVGHGNEGIRAYHGRGDGQFDERRLVEGFPPCARFISTGDFNKDGKGDLALTCFANGLAGISNGDGTYQKTLDVETKGAATSAVSDLNGDGNLDVVLVAVGASQLSVFPGKGDGTFSPEVVLGPTGAEPSFLAVRDLDGDGKDDVVSADTTSSTLTVFWGREGEPFLESARMVTGFQGTASAVADFDRDGRPDFFFGRSSQSIIDVYLDPVRRPSSLPSFSIETKSVYSQLVAVDLNGDDVPDLAGTSLSEGSALVALLDSAGKAHDELSLPAGTLPAGIVAGKLDEGETTDLALPCAGSNYIALFFGLGQGAFLSGAPVPTIETPKNLALGDLDADGRMDMVVSSHALAAHFGKGEGAFTEPLSLIGQGSHTHLDPVIANVSSDDVPDILVSDGDSKRLLLLRGKGGREFEPPVEVKLSSGPRSIFTVDLDGDGLLDITTANINQTVSIIFNRGPEGFAAPIDLRDGLAQPADHRVLDLDQDGALDLVVFGAGSSLIFLGRPAPSSGRFRRGDADENGRVGISDPITVLHHLFLGGPLGCGDAADADDNGRLDLTDPVFTLRWLFQGGAPPPSPGPETCGTDPTPDEITECSPRCQ